jgi:hypothetical protein
VDGGGSGGDVDGNDGDSGDKVRGRDVREIPKDSLSGVSVTRDAELRGILPSAPEDVRANGLRAVPGGCRVNDGWRFVGEAVRGDVMGAGEARELVLEVGLAGLVERDGFEAVERRDVVRPSPALPVRVCPEAGRTVTGGGRYSQFVNALSIHRTFNIHCLMDQLG